MGQCILCKGEYPKKNDGLKTVQYPFIDSFYNICSKLLWNNELIMSGQ